MYLFSEMSAILFMFGKDTAEMPIGILRQQQQKQSGLQLTPDILHCRKAPNRLEAGAVHYMATIY